MRVLLMSLLSALMLFPFVSQADMIVRSYLPERHDRFFNGGASEFVGANYDFSGVGYGSSGHWATLVTDNCFLSAYHLRPIDGEKVTFRSSNTLTGSDHTYTVTGGTRIGKTDIWVGWFDNQVIVDTSIIRYPVLLLAEAKRYTGLILYNYGRGHRVGRNILERFSQVMVGSSAGLSVWYDYDNNDTPSVGGDETCLQTGDSGAPSFADFDSSLALIGIHWAVTNNPVGSIDTFIPAYIDEINAVLADRDQSLYLNRAIPDYEDIPVMITE